METCKRNIYSKTISECCVIIAFLTQEQCVITLFLFFKKINLHNLKCSLFVLFYFNDCRMFACKETINLINTITSLQVLSNTNCFSRLSKYTSRLNISKEGEISNLNLKKYINWIRAKGFWLHQIFLNWRSWRFVVKGIEVLYFNILEYWHISIYHE